jgi:hypothetical protein
MNSFYKKITILEFLVAPLENMNSTSLILINLKLRFKPYTLNLIYKRPKKEEGNII